MITRKEVQNVAGETGFRTEVVEKVLRLHGILARLDRYETTRDAWVLKGGTALNLLHLDVPRLSVDIDINYIGSEDVADMRRMRPDFERALTACCEREGCAVRRAPTEHAGGKFRLRFPSVLGGSQNLEVDVNYVARVPMWGIERRSVRFPPGVDDDVPTLTIEELAAGKFAALLQRSAVRDAFDAASLIEIVPDLHQRRSFRIAFICFMASARTDVRELLSFDHRLGEDVIVRELEPLLRHVSGDRDSSPAEVIPWIRERVSPVMETLLAWSRGEGRFLDRLLHDGEIEPEALIDDAEVQDRIRRQPMLLWKALHVREHSRRS